MNQFPKSISLCRGLLGRGAIAALAIGSLLTPSLSSSVKASLEDSPKAVVDEVWQIIHNEFVDGSFNQTDWQKTRQELLKKDYASKKEAYLAIQQALKELGDPYTRFLEPNQFKALNDKTSGELSGVGLRLQIEQQSSLLTVVEPIENSPALKAGIKAGDKILRINGQPTALMDLTQASQAIQGKIGTQVNLQIARRGAGVFEITLTRQQFEVPSVKHSLKQEGKLKVGYIKLDEFSSHAAEQMKQAIEELGAGGASAFVMDLRGNPGGLLFASVDIARMWMPKGAIVRTVDRRQGDKDFWANQTAITNSPLVVLVDGNSASASEILAGALQENGRATVVGTHTYGKSTVQSVHSLSDGSGLAVTIARYYPPSGRNINHQGILPDVEQDLTTQQQLRLKTDPSLTATSADPQYTRAIAVLKGVVAQQTQTLK